MGVGVGVVCVSVCAGCVLTLVPWAAVQLLTPLTHPAHTRTHTLCSCPLLPCSMLLLRLRGPVLLQNGWAAGGLAAWDEERKYGCIYPRLIACCKESPSKLTPIPQISHSSMRTNLTMINSIPIRNTISFFSTKRTYSRKFSFDHNVLLVSFFKTH